MRPARGSRSSSARHQRRAVRIAFHYLRDAADADEAVQDAFVKAYMHIGTFREELPFEVWFTRILINGCLDRLKARRRRERWIAPPVVDASGVERDPAEYLPSRTPGPEDHVLSRERRRQLLAALVGAAGTAAAGVHVEPFRGPVVARGQSGHGPERIDGARAFVPRHSPAAGTARCTVRDGFVSGEKQPCGSLMCCFVRDIFPSGRSSTRS